MLLVISWLFKHFLSSARPLVRLLRLPARYGVTGFDRMQPSILGVSQFVKRFHVHRALA